MNTTRLYCTLKKLVVISLALIYAENISAQTCDNWLKLPSYPSYLDVPEIDIPGTQITVEAMFVRTIPYNTGTGYNNEGDIISKHIDPTDINYLLRPNHAYITTTNGFFATPDVCEIELNKIYHVALVYDGTTLKFYRNGYLLSQINATGNLIQNNHPTRIGLYNGLNVENLVGYINEVRIWNVARTQSQIRTYMNNSLPNPTTQTGLLAYYTFDNLLNKQGNSVYNGTLNGTASINQANPNCNFIADSCEINTSSPIIVNKYAPVLSFNACSNKLLVPDATDYKVGDTVLLIQMKGAIIDSTNTSSFGSINNYRNCGNYEFNYIKLISNNEIELRNQFLKSYDFIDGKVQIVRVPFYQNLSTTNILTAQAWNGATGGILAINVAQTLTLNHDIDVSGKGFRGGASPNPFNNSLDCFDNDFSYPNGTIKGASKGESIYNAGNNNSCGRGANANGGGGGNGHNSGGGGGSNAGKGGFGGYQLLTCGSSPYDNRGIGGNTLNYSTDKVFMGGGGGSGHADNKNGIDMNGGNGGGIIIINAENMIANGHKIINNGNPAQICNNAVNDCHDAGGGGGAGGTTLLNSKTYTDNLVVTSIGGKGNDLVIYNPSIGSDKIGPGGGGGGGLIWLNSTSTPANLSYQLSGGLNGVIIQSNNDPWGATPGSTGSLIYGLQLPITSVAFKANIDSVRINSFSNGCNNFDFNGKSFTNSSPITLWHWDFGDGTTASLQNTSHIYTSAGNSIVKLIATDANGCKDSSSITVTTSSMVPSPTLAITQPSCAIQSGSILISSPAGPSIIFSLNGSIFQNKNTYSGLVPNNYILVAKDITNGCTSSPIAFTIDSLPQIPSVPTLSNIKQPACAEQTGSFSVVSPVGNNIKYSIDGINYQTTTLFNNLIPGLYTVTAKNSNSNCISTKTTVTINNPPFIPLAPVTTITKQPNCILPSGSFVINSPVGANYSYSIDSIHFQTSLNFSNLVSGSYIVMAKDNISGCVSKTSQVQLVFDSTKSPVYFIPNAFTPNNDGLNDCFGVKNWGFITNIEFSIFNRWGQRIFFTNNPNQCWDGTYKGINQNADTYIYYIKAKSPCAGNITKKGIFVLIR